MELNDQTRCAIILICTYIYKNESKRNLLRTCKFIHKLKSNIFFYQRIIIKTLNKNISQYTNVFITKLNFFKSNKQYLSENLRRLTIEGDFTYDSDPVILPSRLTYLKFLNLPKFDYILRYLPSKLKCLVFAGSQSSEQFKHISNKKDKKDEKYKMYTVDTKINMLSSSIKHLALGISFNKFNLSQIKKIIPKNITHLEFINYDIFSILYEYLFLTKITMQKIDNFPINLSRFISQNITCLCVNNYISETQYWQQIKYVHLQKIFPNILPN